MMKTHFTRHFTLDEARSFLPYLRHKMLEIKDIYHRLNTQGFDIYTGKYKPGFHPDILEEHPPVYRRFMGIVQEILEHGIQIKSIEQGLIDFPAMRADGEEIFLCWQVDENDIYFWHGLQDGFKNRRLLSEL